MMAHTYQKAYSNGIFLHIISTTAENIQLVNLQYHSLSSSEYYGINGGWFNPPGNTRQVISLAYSDGHCVGPNSVDGAMNHVGAGVMYWSGTSLQVVSGVTTPNSLPVYAAGTWAQGGYSMHMGNTNWASLTSAEPAASNVFNDSRAGKSALVAHMSQKRVYLIITQEAVNWATFRTSIQNFMGISDMNATDSTTLQGIFLDGSGSSQMKSKSNGYIESSDNRALCQIVAIRSERDTD